MLSYSCIHPSASSDTSPSHYPSTRRRTYSAHSRTTGTPSLQLPLPLQPLLRSPRILPPQPRLLLRQATTLPPTPIASIPNSSTTAFIRKLKAEAQSREKKHEQNYIVRIPLPNAFILFWTDPLRRLQSHDRDTKLKAMPPPSPWLSHALGRV
jgi:hypothetical protein